jgi:hypothetical protein
MKVALECEVDGLHHHKDIELENLPEVGRIMMVSFGDCGVRPFLVTAVTPTKVQLSRHDEADDVTGGEW